MSVRMWPFVLACVMMFLSALTSQQISHCSLFTPWGIVLLWFFFFLLHLAKMAALVSNTNRRVGSHGTFQLCLLWKVRNRVWVWGECLHCVNTGHPLRSPWREWCSFICYIEELSKCAGFLWLIDVFPQGMYSVMICHLDHLCISWP